MLCWLGWPCPCRCTLVHPVLVGFCHIHQLHAMTHTKTTHFQTTTFSPGTYLAFPFTTLQSTVVVFNGVGMRRTTFVAESLLLKFAFKVIVYETCVVPTSVTVAITRSGNLTFEVERYLHTGQCEQTYISDRWIYRISSNSPSGGIKLIVRVASKSFSRTHWWNRQSSSSTASLIPLSLLSITSLSLRPNLHSGVPVR